MASSGDGLGLSYLIDTQVLYDRPSDARTWHCNGKKRARIHCLGESERSSQGFTCGAKCSYVGLRIQCWDSSENGSNSRASCRLASIDTWCKLQFHLRLLRVCRVQQNTIICSA